MKFNKYLLILFVAIVLIGGFLYVQNVCVPFVARLFNRTPVLNTVGARVTGDIDGVSDSVERGGESLERLGRGIDDIGNSADAIEAGVESLEGRAAELEDGNQTAEKSLYRCRDAEGRGRAAIERGRAANCRLENLIRRLSEEGSAGDPAQEDLADDLDY